MGEPLMAGYVTVLSRDKVVWSVRMLRVGDQIRVSPMLPDAVVVATRPGSVPQLRTLTLAVEIDQRPELVEITVPLDARYQVLSAIRTALPWCRVCRRDCVHYYDAATSTPPTFAICVECDRRIDAEARAELSADNQEDGEEDTGDGADQR